MGTDNVLYARAEGVSVSGGLVGDGTTYNDAQEHIENFFNREGYVELTAGERIYYSGEHEGLPVCLSGRVVILEIANFKAIFKRIIISYFIFDFYEAHNF